MGKEHPAENQLSDPDLASLRSADISFEEQVEIIGAINEVVKRNRIEIKPDTFDFTPKKKGSLIPLLINAAAIVVLITGVFSLLAFFNREERSLIRESAGVLTAEGKLIQALRQESEEQLNQKDRQIADIRSNLENLRKQAESAKQDTEAKILEREIQLRAELDAQLAAEREKLRGEGLSSAAINDQLRDLEKRLSSENEENLAAFRSQSEAQLAEKEAELSAVGEQLQQNLTEFQQERSALQQSFDQREKELRDQLAQQAAEAQSAQAEVADELAALREQRQREQLIFDSILSSYKRVEDSLEIGRYDGALQDLNSLEDYLSQASIAGLPAVRDRVPVERFLIASLRSLIETRRAGTPKTAAVQPESTPSAQADSQIQDLTTRLNQLQTELDRTKASLSRKTRELESSEARLAQRDRELSQAKTTISRQSRQISGYEASQRELAALRQEIGTLRRRYSTLSDSAAADRVSQAKVLDLVDTKLQVREVLSSDSVKREYPELYDAMEDYFETYGKVQTQTGQEEAMEDVISVLDELLDRGSADLSAVKSKFAAAEGDPFSRFLEKLEALLNQ